MAVVVYKENAARFIELAAEENLKAVCVAEITDTDRLRMFYKDELIVDIERNFLDTNGVKQLQNADIEQGAIKYFEQLDKVTEDYADKGEYGKALKYELAKLNNCSQKGAGEVFDATIGAASVLMPFGGKNQLTPAIIMASKPPVSGFTHTVTCSSFGISPELMIESPYTGAIYSIVSAVSKLVASGVDYTTIRLTLQEFFKRLKKEPSRWGEPLSALLGAFDAQINLKLAAIGGKDSMSGTFENIDVPPTLIAFAMGIARDNALINNAFGDSGYIYRFKVQKDEYSRPYYSKLLDMYSAISAMIMNGEIKWATVCESSFCVALAKSLIGNGSGAYLERFDKEHFMTATGDIILITNSLIDTPYGSYIGTLNGSGNITAPNITISVKELTEAFTAMLEPVFRSTAIADGEVKNISYHTDKIFKAKKTAVPQVIIPVFPGTNCEYDMAKAFERAGARAETFVIRNNSAKDIEQSIMEMKK
ncbi:MAG: phosphoribosylformylglycinamidine synthase, partial [Clostridia bacterium]|nr:phosphoribosylformylglycinamidine synthase [Clostridia bacterium]